MRWFADALQEMLMDTYDAWSVYFPIPIRMPARIKSVTIDSWSGALVVTVKTDNPFFDFITVTLGADAFVLNPFIFMAEDIDPKDWNKVLVHERVHIYQQRYFGLFFWGSYLLFWVTTNNKVNVWETMAYWVGDYFYPRSPP